MGLEARAVERDERIALERELRAGERHFECRGVTVVADQGIGKPMRHRIHHASGHDGEMLHARSAKVLHRRQQASTQYADRHRFASRSKSLAEIGSKTMRSPACSNVGGSRPGSNSAIGVRPMRFQPPGVAKG